MNIDLASGPARCMARALRIGAGLLAIACVPLAAQQRAAQPAEDPKQFVQFVEDFDGKCTARNGKMLLVRSTHPSRKLRVWLDRYHMGSGTGDRSRSDLAPGAPAEALGCSRTTDGPQEWRIVRAAFVE
jgi:hypothetical protein